MRFRESDFSHKLGEGGDRPVYAQPIFSKMGGKIRNLGADQESLHSHSPSPSSTRKKTKRMKAKNSRTIVIKLGMS